MSASVSGEFDNLSHKRVPRPREQAGAKTATVLYAADFGVCGDGIVDDGPAISRAVREAVAQQATLRFDEGKTYRIASSENRAEPFSSPFAMAGATGVTVDGGGSVFRFAPELSYFALRGCADMRLCNMVFDLQDTVYLVGTVTAVDGCVVTYATDREPLCEHFDYAGITAFSITYNPGIQCRPHRFLTDMRRTAPCEVAVTYTDDRHAYTVGDVVFLPNPGLGHRYSERIYIGGCTGVIALEDIAIRAATNFIFNIRSNEAEMYFERVDLMPARDDDRAIHMVAWRDGYHCKDNRAPMHWHDCSAGVLFDDVYNVSNTLGYITAVGEDGRLTVVNDEFYLGHHRVVPFDCRVGDRVDVYDPGRNVFCGQAVVRHVEIDEAGASVVTLETEVPLANVTVGSVIANRETGAPGSTVTDCRFTGTFRFIRDIRIERTHFEHLWTWIMAEGDVEGPLPGKVDYVDCVFHGGTMEVGAHMDKISAKIGDIGFWGCRTDFERRFWDGAAVTFSDTWTEEALYTNRP